MDSLDAMMAKHGSGDDGLPASAPSGGGGGEQDPPSLPAAQWLVLMFLLPRGSRKKLANAEASWMSWQGK